MLLKNNSKRSYTHSQLDSEYKLLVLTLKPGEVKEIPDNIAKSWLKSGEVVEYADPQKAKQEQEKIQKENEALKKELEKLKKDCDKSNTTKTKKTTKKASNKSKKS